MNRTATAALVPTLPAGRDLPGAALVQALLARLFAKAQATPACDSHALARSGTLAIERARGELVTCESGSLWITVDGQPQDVMLEAGDRFACPRGQRVLVFALEAAAVRVSQARG